MLLNSFIVLIASCASILAAPQYYIQRPTSSQHVLLPTSHLHTSLEHQSFLQQSLPKVGGESFHYYHQPQQQQVHFSPVSHQVVHSAVGGHHSVPTTVTKDIYVHVAPEEPHTQVHTYQTAQQPPRKHYRIVFIKAPTPSVNKALLNIKQAPTEEKTIIYVLSKKQDPLELQAAIDTASAKRTSKPEVYFIKYKTQEEAEHAQRLIKAEFDKLGGTTNVSGETVAPVTSVVGSVGGHHHQSTGSAASLETSEGDSNKYLPPVTSHK